jgi:hypothetical protein
MWGLPVKGGDIGTLIKAKNTTDYRQNISVGEFSLMLCC